VSFNSLPAPDMDRPVIPENGTLPVRFPGACLPGEGRPSGGREATLPGHGIPVAPLLARGLGILYGVGGPAGGTR